MSMEKCPDCGLFFKSVAKHRAKVHGIKNPNPQRRRTQYAKRNPWSPETSREIAEEFIVLRLTRPLEDTVTLFRESVKKVDPNYGKIPTKIPIEIQQKIDERWEFFINSLTVEIPIIVEKTIEKDFDWERELERLPIETLLEITGRKIGQVLQGFANFKQISNFANIPKPVSEEKEIKIRVAIIGLLPQQQNNLRAIYQGDLKLLFVDKERADKDIPCTVDWIIAHRHIDHCWYANAQKKVGSGRTLFSDGGLSTVLEKLAEIEERQKKLDAQK
jgi:hypothetical protein